MRINKHFISEIKRLILTKDLVDSTNRLLPALTALPYEASFWGRVKKNVAERLICRYVFCLNVIVHLSITLFIRNTNPDTLDF